MGLCYKTSRWLDRLWGEHLELSPPARDLVQQGISKQGESFAGFPADIHARLYLPSDPASIDTSPEWASRLHDLATELGEWQRLRLMCARNGFAAAIAAEAMLEQLLPHVPDAPKAQIADAPAGSPQRSQNPSEPKETPQPAPGRSDPRRPIHASDSDIRATLRKAARAARDAVRNSSVLIEGVASPLGVSLSGSSVVADAGPSNLRSIRAAYSQLKSSRRLQRVSTLAGRLERVASAKVRSKIEPGVGEVHGIGPGSLADLARLLPSEIVTLRRRSLRLHLLARILQGKVLTYAMTGREPQARGPVVVLLDESSSMREAGKDIWSKAVALALLSTATKQRRAWHLVAFNGAIVRELDIPAGKATPDDIYRALDHGCRGGTDFDAPVLRAADVIRHSPAMRKADVVIITDGEDSVSPDTIEIANRLTHVEGVSWFCVGVGPAAELGLQSLAPIATSMIRVGNTDDADELVAPVINLEREHHGPKL